MPSEPISITQGLVPLAQTVLYECPGGSVVDITLMDFANTHSSRVTLNVWKKKGAVLSRISPPNFRFGASYLAQEDGTITLEATDQILASCSVVDVVEYHFNGFISPA